jgi:hemerythrin superfamily protein
VDAITLLKQDHKNVESLFRRFEQAGDRAHKTKRRLVDQMIEELSVHSSIEETVFYPATRDARRETEDEVLESLEEHHLVKIVLSELEGMDPKDERFDAKVTVMMENVRHHIGEEEHDLFPQVRSALGRKELQELGERLEEAKRTAPTRPHPRSPDEPPGNQVVTPVAALLDSAKDAMRKAAGGA